MINESKSESPLIGERSAEEILTDTAKFKAILENGNYACIGVPFQDAIKAAELYASQFKTSEWISVKDKLPKLGHSVLVWKENKGVCIGCVSADGKFDMWDGHPVTHWQPLPDSPFSRRQN